MKLQLNRRSKLDILALLAVGIVGFFSVRHAVTIGDWLHEIVYHPPAQIVQLADDAGMNNTGKKLFYRFAPQMVNAATLRQKCGSDKLGCTAGTHIYILDSSDPTQYNRNIVTAAHEMLHVAYSRLSSADKQAVDANIQQELGHNDTRVAQSIKAQLQTYDPSDYFNEAHSYIGSELSDPGPALNLYYERYFVDRNKATQAFLNSPEGQ
ncbi:MAG TPA: hypothetical protein VFN56_02935 [Candidatus Saccharimonadales bacterium]|nr:hypothetical protein [Candidatus Saccharimonadales bacterium]